MFDLNYVGCELEQAQDLLRFLLEFDLNYVGCELECAEVAHRVRHRLI